MKKIILLYFLSVIAIALTSCLRTIYPIFQKDEQTYLENNLLGKWTDQKSCQFYEFQKYFADTIDVKINCYKLIYYEIAKDSTNRILSTDTVIFKVKLGKIGKRTFLQFEPDQFEDIAYMEKKPYIWRLSYIMGYSFHQLWVEKDSFIIASLNLDWLIEQVKKHKIGLEVYPVSTKDEVTILSNTQKLREFCLKFADNNKAFKDKIKFHRVR